MEENRKIVIVDASVILKWMLPEREDVRKAILLQEDFYSKRLSFLVPAHFHAELANTIGLKLPMIAFQFIHRILDSEFRPCQLSLEVARLAFKFMQKYKRISF